MFINVIYVFTLKTAFLLAGGVFQTSGSEIIMASMGLENPKSGVFSDKSTISVALQIRFRIHHTQEAFALFKIKEIFVFLIDRVKFFLTFLNFEELMGWTHFTIFEWIRYLL